MRVVWVVLALVSLAHPSLGAVYLLDGKRLIISPSDFVGLDVDPGFGSITVPTAGGASDPTLVGASFRVFDTANPVNEAVYALPQAGWKATGAGYRYDGAGGPADPCRVDIRSSLIEVDCRSPGTMPTIPFSGEAGATLSFGANVDQYCTVFGGLLVHNRPEAFKRLFAPAPSSCAPSPVAFEEELTGRVGLIKAQQVARFTSRPGVSLLPDSAGDAPVADGATIRIFDTGSTGGDISYPLPAARWQSARLGYKYRGPIGDPCPTVLLTPRIVKAVCRRDAVDLVTPFTGDAAFVITAGAGARYCAQFGGEEVVNDPVLLRRKNADAPTTCPSPSGAFLEVGADLFE